MNWQNGQEFEACSGQVYGPPVGMMVGGYTQEHQQHPMQAQHQQHQQHQTAWSPPVEVSTTEIPLLNDDHEKAILSDLCEQSVGESTPLSTFSYISEYICSNNIDIWPGEPAMLGSTSSDHTGAPADPKTSEQRSSTVCVHQQLFVRCRRVLESIIARNEQILELLRQRQQQQQTTPKRRQ